MDEKLTSLVNKAKKNAFSIFVIILALFLAKKIYDNQLKGIASLKAKIDIEAKKNDELAYISKLEKKLSYLKDTINNKNMSKLINKISSLAKRSEVKIVSIKPQKEKYYISYVAFPFEIAVTSKDYHTLGQFIDQLENSEDIFIIQSLGIKQALQGKGIKAKEQVRVISAAIRLDTILIPD